MSKKPCVYFAAPLFTQAEWQWNSHLANELRQLNLDIILPQSSAEPMLNGEMNFDAHALFITNIGNMDKADVVLAILDQSDPDSGTCWECGYAYKAGYPIVGLRTDLRRCGDDPNSSVNLMLSQSCKELVEAPLSKRNDLTSLAQVVALAIHRVMSSSSQLLDNETQE